MVPSLVQRPFQEVPLGLYPVKHRFHNICMGWHAGWCQHLPRGSPGFHSWPTKWDPGKWFSPSGTRPGAGAQTGTGAGPGAVAVDWSWSWAWWWADFALELELPRAASPLTASPSLIARTCGLFMSCVCSRLWGLTKNLLLLLDFKELEGYQGHPLVTLEMMFLGLSTSFSWDRSGWHPTSHLHCHGGWANQHLCSSLTCYIKIPQVGNRLCSHTEKTWQGLCWLSAGNKLLAGGGGETLASFPLNLYGIWGLY